MSKRLLILIASIVFVAFSCNKYDDYSPIPEVEYGSMELLTNTISGDDYLNISIKFIDGDGDICFYKQDTVRNIVYTLYYLENDTFKLIDLAVPYEWKIPYYEPEGRNKLMRGTVKSKFYIYEFDLMKYDTLKLDFYVFDRAYNKSNVGSTPLIIVNDYL